MILIFEYVYKKYVFYVGEDVVEKIVFGRDVLINECVYFSQLVMMNNESELNCFVGVVYRFEGFY